MITIHLDNGEKEQFPNEDLISPDFIENIRDYLQMNAALIIKATGYGGIKYINSRHILMIEVSDGPVPGRAGL